jgi:hypothetical protein
MSERHFNSLGKSLGWCVMSLVTASKERQTGAKSCKAGKLHSADEIIPFTLDKCEYRSAANSFWNWGYSVRLHA